MDFRTIYDALDFFRHRWTMEILASLQAQPKGFNDLQRSVNAVHATSFNQALQRLVDQGLISRPEPGARGQVYALTPVGERAFPLIVAFVDNLGMWGEARTSQEHQTRRSA
ncbi:helix-turn-helix domain-containing protein [Dactylosporangium sp. NPDC051485]|uniref:winged helix-turn-helix transcriptional regulator n=1 Tax=Dactylosporangium sp. NPDC051485 TaxID=3154846 RepID=UPI0034329A0F